MTGTVICAWCLNTPPRHDRCTGDTADRYYGTTSGVACRCDCRVQGVLW